MATLKLYIDIQKRLLVRSFTNPAPAGMLSLVQGNQQPVYLYFLEEQESISTPLVSLNYNSATIKLRLGLLENSGLEGYFKFDEFELYAKSKKEDIRAVARKFFETEKVEVKGPDGGPWIIALIEVGEQDTPDVESLNLYPEATVILTTLKQGSTTEAALFMLSLKPEKLVEVTSWADLSDTHLGQSGVIDLTGDPFKAVIAGKKSIDLLMEIEVTPTAGQVATVLSQPIKLLSGLS